MCQRKTVKCVTLTVYTEQTYDLLKKLLTIFLMLFMADFYYTI